MKALREIRDEDHDWLLELHNDPLVLQNLTNPTPISVQQHMQWWYRTKDDPRQKRLIYTVDDERVGFTKFYDIDHNNNCCVLGADIHKSFRGKSLAKPMWKLMIEHCFVELNLHRISLTTAEYNLIAMNVYAGVGFQKEGMLNQSLFRNGKYYDQVMMYMLRSDREWASK